MTVLFLLTGLGHLHPLSTSSTAAFGKNTHALRLQELTGTLTLDVYVSALPGDALERYLRVWSGLRTGCCVGV